ncbi:hypothetical protein N7495_004210 [Penicillium taxi]|uniref:uncharacterized protein n=1 Tax=Penicillium taxi TaxID=168475 RepID=UPI002544E1AF|nr:uncharacterized protein N7495_004210 [Penicillium taxi]KAJ5899466.1 hypothetical protein N7495_004210 [Penicillium taxi]
MLAVSDGSPSTATDIATPSAVSVVSSSPPAISGSPNESGPPLRPLRSKSSLWSIGSSNYDEETDPTTPSSAEKTNLRPSNVLRRLSPALAARVKLLDSSQKVTSAPRNPNAVGRIPEEHLKELDNLHQDLSIKVERRGQAWGGITFTSPLSIIKRRTESNNLALPSCNLLEEVNKAQEQEQEEQGTDHFDDAAIDGPEPSVLAATHAPEANCFATSMSVAELAPAQSRAGFESESLPNNKPQDTRTDFEKYVDDTKRSEEGPPLPPPKDATRTYSISSSYKRAESIFSFSRASFSNQLSQLTSIPLPHPVTLETSIRNISTALAAVRALNGSAEQIQIWIQKASDVLNGLDSEDDVEWAAAGGREGLEGVDKAITRFESLVNVYTQAIENVQFRDDIANVDAEDLRTIVRQMESILQNWGLIKKKLRGVKQQVELAMEWEELWSNVLGDVGTEIESLSGTIFEMEEKRHQALMDPPTEPSGGLDINELETIVEDPPTKGRSPLRDRLSLGPVLPMSSSTPVIKTPQDDSSYSDLMALFARMQPLRASLDFLPMRLSMFQSRAETIFPSACEELDDRRTRMEDSYKVLEQDSEALRKELGEDKWIIVFRNAGGQAQKMFDSVERSIAKVQESLEANAQVNSPSTLSKRMENYEAKKTHYVPAIERVIAITMKGVNERLTVNGEILRLLSDMQSRMDALKASIKVMDSSLEDVHIVKGHQLRDSISSILTLDSPIVGSASETPSSSPASSVVLSYSGYSGYGNGYKGASTPLNSSSRHESSAGSTAGRSTMPNSRRFSGIPQGAANTGRKSSIPKPSGLTSPGPYNPSNFYTPTPASRRVSRVPLASPMTNRPRWNASTNLNDLDTGYTSYKTSSGSSGGTYRRPASTVPPSGRDISSPAPSPGRSLSRLSTRFASSSRSPTPARSTLLDPPPYSRLRRPSALASTTGLVNSARNRMSFAGVGSSFGRSVSQAQNKPESPIRQTRPGTSLGHSSTNRRMSLLPLPKRNDKDKSTPQKVDTRPRWRG